MLKKILLFLCLCASLSLVAPAQTTGTPSYDPTVQISPYESVELAGLDALFQAPVRAKGGPIPLNFMLTMNVSPYQAYNRAQQAYITKVTTQWGPTVASGYWRGWLSTAELANQPCSAGTTNLYTIYAFIDGNGTSHPLPANTKFDTLGCIATSAIDVFAADNSGYEFTMPKGSGSDTVNATVYQSNGTYVTLPVDWTNSTYPVTYYGTVTDAIGNQVNFGNTGGNVAVTDALGSVSAPIPDVLDFPYPGVGPLTYTDGTGMLQSVSTTSYSGHQICPGGSCATGIYPAAWSPLNTINFPDGSDLAFTWHQTGGYDDGFPATVTIPTGAVYTHTFTIGSFDSGAGGPLPTTTGITVNNGAGTWTFARTKDANYTTNRTTYTTVTKPDGSKLKYTFQYGYPTLVVTYDTNGTTVLDTETTCYDSTLASCNSTIATASANLPFTTVGVYRTVPGVTGQSGVVTTYDSTGHGEIIEVDAYDFGPTLVSKTITSYGSWNGSGCTSMTGRHITGKPCDVQVQDTSNNVLSHTRYKYNTTTGNLLNVYAYSSATNYLTTTYTYSSTNGMLSTKTDADGVLSTYSNTLCNNYLPASVTTAIGTASMTWDCNGAVPLTTTDLNGLTVTNTYGDPLYRVTEVSDNGGQAPLTYSYSPTQVRKDVLFNSNASISDTTTTLNSLGQVQSMQRRQTPSSSLYDTISYTYDATGHLSTVSQPCQAALGGVCTGTLATATTYTYDGMNRLLTVKQNTSTNGVLTYSYPNGDVKAVLTPAPSGEVAKTHVIERDGLGRTIRECAVSSTLSGTASCGMRSGVVGYETSFTLDAAGRTTKLSRNAQGTSLNEVRAYDFLGRVTSESLPNLGPQRTRTTLPWATARLF